MRGKGHCRLNFETDELELKLFYDYSEDTDEGSSQLADKAIFVPNDDELHLPSGKTLGRRQPTRVSRRKLSVRASMGVCTLQQLLQRENPGFVPMVSNDRQIVMRAGTSTSMIGVPDVQLRSLIATEQKIHNIETRKMNVYQSKVDRGGNCQKRFRVVSMGKKQGGLEKRLG
jgi:pre-60S factor REI1